MRIGGYDLEGELGKGGMGVVHRARGPDGRPVALKVLLRSWDERARARFDRERRLLGQLGRAEGFVPLLAAGDSPQGPWLALELEEGGNLRTRIDAGRLGIDETIELGRALALALSRAHALGIVHRDVKPENVLFTREGEPLLTDLGLGRHADRSAPGASASRALSATGELLGTVGYLAPELLQGGKDVTPGADVFALAVTLYEALAGTKPFAGTNGVEILAATLDGQFRSLRRLRPEVPAWLARAIERELGAGRRGDALAFARALSGPAATRRLPLVLAAGALALAGAGGFAAAGLGAGRPAVVAPPPPPTPSRAEPRPTPRPPPLGEADRLLDRARSLGDAEALPLLERAVELAPERADLRLRLSRARFATGDFVGALGAAREATRLAPLSARARAAEARALVAVRSEREGATEAVDRALELGPADAEVWCATAFVRDALGLAGVTEAIARALELDPAAAEVLVLLARRAVGSQDAAGALALAHRATEAAPFLADAWEVKAGARFQLGDRKGAIADATRALDLSLTHPTAYSVRASSRELLGDHAGAIEDATLGLALRPSGIALLEVRGVARSRSGDVTGGIEDASRALELDPRPAEAWGRRASMRRIAGDLAGTLSDYDEAIARDPQSATWRYNRGEARVAAGRARDALSDLERAVVVAPDHSTAWLLLGDVRRTLGDRAGAAAAFRRAVALLPPGEARAQAEASLGTVETP